MTKANLISRLKIYRKSFCGIKLKGISLIWWLILSLSLWSSMKTLRNYMSQTDDEGHSNFQSSRNGAVSISKTTELVVKKKEWCGNISGDANFCDLEGDIRVQADKATIFLMTSNETILNSTRSWDIKPYPRFYVPNLRHWTVKLVRYNDKDDNVSLCTQNHNNPSILFSMYGHSGNYYHSFSDLLFPLYITSFEFQGDVDLLATDYRVSWVTKFQDILSRFTRQPILDIDKENGKIHCYKKMFVGLKFYRDLLIDQSAPEYALGVSMPNFRQLLRDTYLLERKNATLGSVNPRLMIVTRTKTRIIINQDEVAQAARELGFVVVLAEADGSTNLSKFAQGVNSCDAMVGIHGAGLTNMLFLPDNGVVIQLIPLGGIEWWAKVDFGYPPAGMNLRYLEYNITTNESTLGKLYPSDHPFLTHPETFHKAKWELILKLYLDNQNFTIDIERFKHTLVKAMELLKN
uniref:GT61_8 n=1 Tax=Plantago ovata TaxID=185002 RepID=A0A1P8KZX6_PLAOV|nr:GT61_8 [Plantago ovata]